MSRKSILWLCIDCFIFVYFDICNVICAINMWHNNKLIYYLLSVKSIKKVKFNLCFSVWKFFYTSLSVRGKFGQFKAVSNCYYLSYAFWSCCANILDVYIIFYLCSIKIIFGDPTFCNKNVDIKFSAHSAFLENLHRVRSYCLQDHYWIC